MEEYVKKDDVISLARELFKIRITSSREGSSQDDGMHKLTVEGITSYTQKVIELWYAEALQIAEILVAMEYAYREQSGG